MSDFVTFRTLLAGGFVVIGSCCFLYIFERSRYWSRRGLRGPKCLPFLRDLRTLVQPLHSIYHSDSIKFASLYGTFRAGDPALVVSEPEAIEALLVSDVKYFGSKCPNVQGHWVSSLARGRKCSKGTLSRAISSKKLKRLHEKVNQCTERTLSRSGQFEVDLWTFALEHVFEALGSAFHSKRGANMRNRSFCERLRTFFVSLFGFATVDGRFSEQFSLDLMSTLDSRLDEWPPCTNSSAKKPVDILQFILNLEGASVSREDVQAGCVSLFEAALESTATLIMFALYELSSHEAAQEELYNELFAAHPKATVDHILSLSYLDAVVSETLRLHPPITSTGRRATNDYAMPISGLLIERGTAIEVPISAVHTDATFWPNPTSFEPERFVGERKDEIVAFSFLPFGVGGSQCLGSRLSTTLTKVLLAQLIRKFEISLISTSPLIYFKMSNLLRLSSPIKLAFKERRLP